MTDAKLEELIEAYAMARQYSDWLYTLRAKQAILDYVEKEKEEVTKAIKEENVVERLEAVQCIVASPCDREEAHCAYEELDAVIPIIKQVLGEK